MKILSIYFEHTDIINLIISNEDYASLELTEKYSRIESNLLQPYKYFHREKCFVGFASESIYNTHIMDLNARRKLR